LQAPRAGGANGVVRWQVRRAPREWCSYAVAEAAGNGENEAERPECGARRFAMLHGAFLPMIVRNQRPTRTRKSSKAEEDVAR